MPTAGARADNAKAYSTRTVSSLRRRNAMHTTRVADEPTAAGGYRPVGIDEDGTTVHHKQASRVQWFFIGALDLRCRDHLGQQDWHAGTCQHLASVAGSFHVRQRNHGFRARQVDAWRERWARLDGTDGSIIILLPALEAAQHQEAGRQGRNALRRVLIGSHFGLGNELLKRLFGDLVSPLRGGLSAYESPPSSPQATGCSSCTYSGDTLLSLVSHVSSPSPCPCFCPPLPPPPPPVCSPSQCQRSRLALRCEPVGGAHDLKSLAAARLRKRRLVWLESDAGKLLRTFRGVKAHASDFGSCTCSGTRCRPAVRSGRRQVAAAAEAAAEAAAAVAEAAVAEAAAAATALYPRCATRCKWRRACRRCTSARNGTERCGSCSRASKILCHGDRDPRHGGSCSSSSG